MINHTTHTLPVAGLLEAVPMGHRPSIDAAGHRPQAMAIGDGPCVIRHGPYGHGSWAVGRRPWAIGRYADRRIGG